MAGVLHPASISCFLPSSREPLRKPRQFSTNLVEGINSRIKVIKRIAYGFRDDAYFFLKIRASFPELG